MNEKTIHVGLTEPVMQRKEILNSALESIQVLKGYETLKLIRKEKQVYAKELRIAVKELKELVVSLDEEHLPSVKVETQRPVAKKEERADVREPARPKLSPEMDELERDIIRIKEKISRL